MLPLQLWCARYGREYCGSASGTVWDSGASRDARRRARKGKSREKRAWYATVIGTTRRVGPRPYRSAPSDQLRSALLYAPLTLSRIFPHCAQFQEMSLLNSHPCAAARAPPHAEDTLSAVPKPSSSRAPFRILHLSVPSPPPPPHHGES